ncbi:MAG TPA: hypothetical protein VK083_01770 [Nocardia sp.]|uniref:hypothetical protein n=1 Tax=Nocardia TaxID=1817 RepID=UPI0024553797|nr:MULTISPECIES: hypothetical protein [Nocardia]HLS75501.1 hypothetical protein [Nocardia sp.]
MRHHLHRTAAVCAGLALAAAVVLTGCSDDESGEAAETTTASAAATTTEAAAADPATIEAIETTYATFFDSTRTPEERAAKVQQSEAFLPVLQAQAANPQSTGLGVEISEIELIDDSNAAVTYTLVMGGNPVLADQAGEAVEENGEWLVAATTFCTLMALQGGTSPAC